MAKKSTGTVDAMSLALAKIEASGLDANDLTKLHMTVLTAAETGALHASFKLVPSLKIDYIDPATGKPLSPMPEWSNFFRTRYLKLEADSASVLTHEKPQRYAQMPGSGVCAYFPTNVDWKVIIDDERTPIIITEGELKAACACKYGYPTIGIGGVWNWQVSKLGLMLLPELERVKWAKRNVYLIFDSDFRINASVCKAANKLAERLMARGALVHFVPLPDVVEGGKTGLDDYIVNLKNKDDLGKLIHEKAEPMTISAALWGLNEKVIYIQDPGMVLVQGTDQKMNPSAFVNHAYANVMMCEQVLHDDGTMSLKDVPAAEKWLKWAFRATVHNITYRPGQPKLLADTDEWNVWPGMAVQPLKGDASLFTRLIDHLFTGADPKAKRWFYQWLAWPLQHPGAKLFTCIAMHGLFHGTGKSLVAFTLGHIYGKNFVGINEKDMDSSFTGSLVNKQFVLIDDVTGSDKRDKADRVKTMITQKEVKINIKYVPEYWIPDCINYFFTSNQPDAFFIEDKDRRYFVHEVKVGPLADSFYKEYDTLLGDPKFLAAVYHFLLNIDTTDFNPNAAAFMTQDKRNMIEDVKTDTASWACRLLQDADNTLMFGRIRIDGDLFTNSELLGIYDRDGKTRTTANSLGRELRRAGALQVLDGAPIKTVKGQDRYYCIRNADRWMNAKRADIIKYLNARYEMGEKK